MYYNFNYYVSYFKLVCIVILIIMLFNLFFKKFIVRELNSKMVKSRMVMLIKREKIMIKFKIVMLTKREKTNTDRL
jgi:hypothetical protein